MAQVFGLHPWDLDKLTYWQWARFRRHLDQLGKER